MDSEHLAVHTWKFRFFLRAVSGSFRVRESALLLEEFHIFSSCWLSQFPAQFELENLDIISTCSRMAVGGGFLAFLGHFSALLQVVWRLAPFFGALDGEEFFAIEDSCTISTSAFVDIDVQPERSCLKQPQQPQHPRQGRPS